MPVLYFTVSHLLDRGADVLQVDYDYNRRSDYSAMGPAERQRWLLADVLAACRVGSAQRPYRRFTLIGKSLGTRALPILLTAEPAFRTARTIWFTPVWHEPDVRGRLLHAAHPALIVIGTADPHFDVATLDAVRAVGANEVVALDGVDHGLELPGDIVESVRALGVVMQAVQRFTR